MNLHTIRQICLVSLPLLMLTGVLAKFYFELGGWADYLYIVALTANIGYFTNFIAIKMLFKPYVASALGRQGLIPKNQSKLATALSGTLSEHFLASEHWQEYLNQSNIIPPLLSSSRSYCESWMVTPGNSEKLIQILSDYLQQNESKIHPLFEQLQAQLIDEIAKDMDIDSMLEQGFSWVEQQFEERPLEMEFMIEPVVKTVAENIPLIAEQLVATVDQHIESQGTIKRGIAKAARWSADISEEDVKQYLFRMVASSEFRKTLFEGLQSLISEYKKRSAQPTDSESPGRDFDIKSIIQTLLKTQTASINIAQQIGKSLQKNENKQALTHYLKASIEPAFQWLEKQLSQPEIEQMINQQIIKIIEAIDLKEIIEDKARNFSPKQMETIFQSMIADQLVFIELLGALLGALSGLALIDIKLFSGFAGIMATIYGLDIYLTKKRDNTKSAKLITQQE